MQSTLDTDEMTQRSLRLPNGLWRRVEAHAQKLSARAGGVKVSYNAAIKEVLERCLDPVAEQAPIAESKSAGGVVAGIKRHGSRTSPAAQIELPTSPARGDRAAQTNPNRAGEIGRAQTNRGRRS